MKKTLFNLQLFAEGDPVNNTEPGANPNTDPTGEPQGEPGTDPKPGSAKKYDDDDVNRIVKQKKIEWQKQQEKAVDEAKKLAAMNAEEKANYTAQQEKERADKVQKELDEYKRKDALNEMSKTARKMLSDEGISIPDDLLSRLVTTDAEETKAAVDGFAKLFKDSVEAAVKEKLRGETPKAGTSGGAAVSEIDKRIKKYEI